jgi:hypothetical protein
MQANRMQRSSSERENKGTQRAVLSLVLHEFPSQMTREHLECRGFKGDSALDAALGALGDVGLVWCEGAFVLPTLAARHFDWLELS